MTDEKYGFVYLWYDKKYKRFYVGSHWGNVYDGYICSSTWMRKSFRKRPNDFKRRIVKRDIKSRDLLYEEEQRWLNMVKKTEIKPTNPNPRYYNLCLTVKDPWYKHDLTRKSVGEKISAAKKGKSTGPCSPEKARKISEAKRQRRLEKEAAGLSIYNKSEKVIAAIEAKKGKAIHSEEHKKNVSNRMRGNTYGVGHKHSEEHKKRMGDFHRGRKRTDSTRNNIAIANSKKYIITYMDGRTETITGLKLYANTHNIPYITLHKASIFNNKIPKYNIHEVKVA